MAYSNLYQGQWNPGGRGLGAPPPGDYTGDQQNIKKINALGDTMAGAFGQNNKYADMALQTAFDPNKEQFKDYSQQLSDQTNAAEAARGISMSPYGAGVSANAQGNFNNQWQTAQVGRQAQGAQTATGLQGQWQSGQQAAAGMYAQSAGINQHDIGLQLQAYGLQGQELIAAQQMMYQYLSGESGLAEKRYEFDQGERNLVANNYRSWSNLFGGSAG